MGYEYILPKKTRLYRKLTGGGAPAIHPPNTCTECGATFQNRPRYRRCVACRKLAAQNRDQEPSLEKLIAEQPATEWHGPWPHMNEAECEAWTRKLLGPLATPDYYRRDADHPHKTPLHEISQEGRQRRIGPEFRITR